MDYDVDKDDMPVLRKTVGLTVALAATPVAVILIPAGAIIEVIGVHSTAHA
jgi:hypothetical protein